MPIRNHITRIQKADGQVKGTEEVEKKAQAEVQKADPKNADQAIKGNEIDGNGSGIKFTLKKEEKPQKVGGSNPNTVLDDEEKRAKASGGQTEDQKQQEENEKKAEDTRLKAGDIAQPATSKEKNEKK